MRLFGDFLLGLFVIVSFPFMLLLSFPVMAVVKLAEMGKELRRSFEKDTK